VITQYPLSAIKSCEIQNIQYRKPGPVVPTLVITFEPDSGADKARKRRSSRAGGLSSGSNAYPNSLLFRTIPEERYSIYDWQILIQPQIKPNTNYDIPLSPDSSTFTTFINPFSPRSPIAERSPMSPRPEPYRRGSNATYTSTQSVQTRERAQTSTLISPSPSLRSKSSNISSQASSFGRPQGYQTILPIQHMPADLPSPVSTTGFDDGSILGWTSAQGRSSALSHHTRGSNSISTAGTPPAPRETILDRAFQMRYIPGSDKLSTVEDDGGKLSSIARFEALMREAERKAKSKPTFSEPTGRKGSIPSWDLEEEGDDESDFDMEVRPTRPRASSNEDVDMEDENVNPLAVSIQEMPTPAQRALEYISGRSTPQAAAIRRPKSPPSAKFAPPPEPTRSRTTPPRAKPKERPKSMFYQPSPSSHKHKKSDDSYISKNTTSTVEKRRSSNSTKRLSFTEFTQRLSSTSSLLLVQTNNSSSSAGVASSRNSRQSSEASFVDDQDDGMALHRGLSQSRLSGMGGVVGTRPPVPEIDSKRCGWRGSGLGVFGGEGGFL
jgi:hypothetical protein